MLFMSMFVEIFFYWNIVAILPLMPLIAGWVRRRWVAILHILYGTILAVGFAFNQTAVPVAMLWGASDWTAASIRGWPETAARVGAFEKQYNTNFVVESRYTTAAQLGFAMHDPEVTAISSRHDQYDFWFDPAAHQGQDAIIVSDPQLGLADINPYFELDHAARNSAVRGPRPHGLCPNHLPGQTLPHSVAVEFGSTFNGLKAYLA